MHRRHPPQLRTLNQATPKVTEQYKRFAELVQTYGQGGIESNQTHIDYHLRTNSASV